MAQRTLSGFLHVPGVGDFPPPTPWQRFKFNWEVEGLGFRLKAVSLAALLIGFAVYLAR
jgi:hypothetical protein